MANYLTDQGDIHANIHKKVLSSSMWSIGDCLVSDSAAHGGYLICGHVFLSPVCDSALTKSIKLLSAYSSPKTEQEQRRVMKRFLIRSLERRWIIGTAYGAKLSTKQNLFAESVTLSLPFLSFTSKTPADKHLIKASSLASVSLPDLQTVTSHGAAGSCQAGRRIDM